MIDNPISIAIGRFLFGFCSATICNAGTKMIDEIVPVKRLPSKYHDVLALFHELLNDFIVTRKNIHECLVIIIDGLDEAAVAFSEFHIKDYFSTYDENGEIIDEWKSPLNMIPTLPIL